MATASPEAIRALTGAYRAQQARRAAALAALVAAYYRTRVDPGSTSSIERWLEIMVPRVLREHENQARAGAQFGDAIRRLELPDLRDGFKFEPVTAATEEQIRTSLSVVGPVAYQNKMTDIRGTTSRRVARVDEEDRVTIETVVDEALEQQMIADAKDVTSARIAGAVARHAQNGGRATVHDNVQRDRVALGWIRVTRENPCYFCAMLASRGIEWGPYSEKSFDRSDARFTGEGRAKVHDACQCSVKPVYTEEDALLDRSREFEALWYEYSEGGGKRAILTFRQGYEGRSVK